MSERERDERGRWVKGVSGNDGRKYKARMNAAFRKAVKPSEFTAIVKKVVKQALSGDTRAQKIVLEYVLGKPIAFVEIDATVIETQLGIDEWWDEVTERFDGLEGNLQEVVDADRNGGV